MERLFLDADVLFAAAISPRGTAQGLFHLARIGACALIASEYAADEARRNLRAKYAAARDVLDELLDEIELVREANAALVEWAEAHLPPKDAPILAAAAASKADVLVTGDRRHFGEHYKKELAGVVVLSPRMTLERLLTPEDS